MNCRHHHRVVEVIFRFIINKIASVEVLLNMELTF